MTAIVSLIISILLTLLDETVTPSKFDGDFIIRLVAILLGTGGLTTALIALLKWRPEAGQITVTAAQGAVIVQTGVIENLHKELARVEKELEEEREEKRQLIIELQDYKKRLRKLEDSFYELRGRTCDLEAAGS